MPETETTTVRKATQQREGRAVVRTVKSEATTRRVDTVVRKVESDLKTRSEVPDGREEFRATLAGLEARRQALPESPVAFNARAAELYEALRQEINKLARAGGQHPAWKKALRDLIEDTKRARAATVAMQLHGEARQARQKEYWQTALDGAFRLLRGSS